MSTRIGFQNSVVPTRQRIKFVNTPARLVMRKKGIHPHLYEEAKVYCKGEHVLTLSGTQEEYHVDIWSGNHPLFNGQKKGASVDDGRLSRFAQKYAGLGDLLEVPSMEATSATSSNSSQTQTSKKSKGKKTDT